MLHYLKINIDHDDHEEIIDPVTNYERYKPLGVSIEIEQTHKFIHSDINIDSTGYTPSQGDRLYFLPGCNVPRIKMKDLTLQYGIKSVRDIADANIIVGSNNTVAKITRTTWEYLIPVELFKEFVEIYKSHLDDYTIDNINTALEFYQLDHVICDWSSLKYFTDEDYTHYDTLKNSPSYQNSYNHKSLTTIEEGFEKEYANILNKNIINEACILEHLNGPDSVIIDHTMFNQLSGMFNSSDEDNHILAMEIMANSNYKQSLLYLEMLFCNHYNRIYNSRTKNHVNFKSLISYLGKYNGLSTDIDDIITSLAKRNVLTPDKIDIILDNYKNEIISRGEYNHFKIKEITVSENMLAILKKPYVYKVIEFTGYEEEPDIILDEVILEEVCEDVISNEDIETAFSRIERNELKSELVALEGELNEDPGTLEAESNNDQIEEKNESDSFEWF